jgi:formamidopyrimidine-DNA glycosylase
MPELPEVESVLRVLCDAQPSLISRRIQQVLVHWDGALSEWTAADFRKQLMGAVFATAGRHGKYLIFGLDRADFPYNKRKYLVVHLRMTGTLTLVRESENQGRYTRLALMLDQDLALCFDDPRKFGRVWLVDDPGEVTAKLGPDALTVDYDLFAERFETYRRQLKPLLLDQSFVSGIGNIYADESLHRAGLHPLTNSMDLSPLEIRRLYDAVISILREAVADNGANIDGVFKAGMFRVNVYARQGQSCFSCGATIIKTRVGQRGTHFCPVCQILKSH